MKGKGVKKPQNSVNVVYGCPFMNCSSDFAETGFLYWIRSQPQKTKRFILESFINMFYSVSICNKYFMICSFDFAELGFLYWMRFQTQSQKTKRFISESFRNGS